MCKIPYFQRFLSFEPRGHQAPCRIGLQTSKSLHTRFPRRLAALPTPSTIWTSQWQKRLFSIDDQGAFIFRQPSFCSSVGQIRSRPKREAKPLEGKHFGWEMRLKPQTSFSSRHNACSKLSPAKIYLLWFSIRPKQLR